LLPVYDDVNRSIDSIEKGETKDFETLKTGIKHIQDKFKKVLKKEGLKEIDVLGKEFDVNLCDALLQVPKEGVKPNTVIDVVEKGFYLKDKVIRHAKVLVSSEAPENNKGN
jgi:molecular chaperone GrpE